MSDPTLSVNAWRVEEGHTWIYQETFGDGILQSDLILARHRGRTWGLGVWGGVRCPLTRHSW